jgi:hypothetical protein
MSFAVVLPVVLPWRNDTKFDLDVPCLLALLGHYGDFDLAFSDIED